MSSQEIHIGVLEKIEYGEDIEAFCKELLYKNDIKIWDYYNSHKEQVCDDLHGEYVIIDDDKIYKIKEDRVSENGNIFYTKTEGNEVNFVVSYYNGGYSLGEAIAEAMRKEKRNYYGRHE